jgi:hypothetical protein
VKLFSEFFSHLFLDGLIVAACLFGFAFLVGCIGYVLKIFWVIFYPLYLITLKPVIWGVQTLFQSRCPSCKGFFKRKLVDWKTTDEREVLRTVERLDTGVLYSNHLLVPNQGFEVSRQEQVSLVEKTILNRWACKDPICGHTWESEEYSEAEGSLEI